MYVQSTRGQVLVRHRCCLRVPDGEMYKCRQVPGRRGVRACPEERQGGNKVKNEAERATYIVGESHHDLSGDGKAESPRCRLEEDGVDEAARLGPQDGDLEQGALVPRREVNGDRAQGGEVGGRGPARE